MVRWLSLDLNLFQVWFNLCAKVFGFYFIDFEFSAFINISLVFYLFLFVFFAFTFQLFAYNSVSYQKMLPFFFVHRPLSWLFQTEIKFSMEKSNSCQKDCLLDYFFSVLFIFQILSRQNFKPNEVSRQILFFVGNMISQPWY